MRYRAYRVGGFTLIELIITVAVLSALVTIGLPGMVGLMGNVQMRAARSSLATSLNQARITAVNRGAVVTLCPSNDGSDCSEQPYWHKGWLIFTDLNQDGQRNADEPLLSMGQAQPENLAIISSSGRSHISYRPDGSATGTNLTLTFCDRRGANYASTLVVNNAGRVRLGKPSVAAASMCTALL